MSSFIDVIDMAERIMDYLLRLKMERGDDKIHCHPFVGFQDTLCLFLEYNLSFLHEIHPVESSYITFTKSSSLSMFQFQQNRNRRKY